MNKEMINTVDYISGITWDDYGNPIMLNNRELKELIERDATEAAMDEYNKMEEEWEMDNYNEMKDEQ
jgi:hypothetical protein